MYTYTIYKTGEWDVFYPWERIPEGVEILHQDTRLFKTVSDLFNSI